MSDHFHKFFGFQVKAEFEPLPPKFVKDINVTKDLYRRVEYIITVCNCGTGKKTRLEVDE